MSESSTTPEVSDDQPVNGFTLTAQQIQAVNSRLIAAKFGDIVTVLMQSPHHAGLRLADLRNRIVPPLVNDQYRLAEVGKEGSGSTVPAALILWAKVSDSVHERMMKSLDQPFELAPEEWTSGENYWIIDAVGLERFLTPLLADLRAKDLKGKTVHYRAKSPDGPQLKTFEPEVTAEEAAAS